MDPKEIAQLTDQELQDEFHKIKASPITDAFLIGFLVGIIIFSVVVSTWGLFSLIPLYLIYVFLKKSKKYEALKEELKKRNG